MQQEFSIGQRVRIKTSNGNHRGPSDNAKGALGTISPQMTTNWLKDSEIVPPETTSTFYVDVDEGITELLDAAWLEAAE